MGAKFILILAVVVSVAKALVYDPHGSVSDGSTYYNDYNDVPYGYNGNAETSNDLSNANREKLLAIVTALLQQDNNPYGPYSPFTDLFTFKGNKGKNQVSWRKWLGWSKNQIGIDDATMVLVTKDSTCVNTKPK